MAPVTFTSRASPPEERNTAPSPAGSSPGAARAAPRPLLRHMRVPALTVLPPLLLGIAVLALWQIARSANAAPELLLPAPAAVVGKLWLLLTTPELRSSIGTTVVESVGGACIGAAIALPLGYAVARSPLLARMLQPYLAASQAIPAVAVAPLLALILGYGLGPIIALCALIVFFPLVVTTTLGLRAIDPEVLDAARVDGAYRWALLWFIELPLALPSILAGLRTSLTLSITGAVVGEFVIGGSTGDAKGLGQLLGEYLSAIDGAGVFATVLALALLSALYYGVARLIERRFSILEAK